MRTTSSPAGLLRRKAVSSSSETRPRAQAGDDLVQYQKAEAHRPAAAKGGGQEVGIFRPCLPPFFLCHLEDELADIRTAGSLHAQPVQQGHLRGTAVFEKLDEEDLHARPGGTQGQTQGGAGLALAVAPSKDV